MDFIGEDFNGSVEFAIDKLTWEVNLLKKEIRKLKADNFNMKRELFELKEIK